VAHKFNRRGSWVIDRRYKSIGRIRRASGAKTKKTFDAILKMLEILHEQGKHTVLREIQAGIVSPIEAFGYWREDKLEYLPSTETLKKLSPTFDEWVETYNVVPITRRNYKSAVKTFVSTVGNVPIQELPKAIKKYKKHCLHRNTPRAFSSLRTPILSFLRDTFGRHSVLYASVSEIKKLAEHDEEDGNQAPQLTVKEAQSLLKALPPQHGEIAVAMLVTGMHWEELVGKWEVQEDRVWIHGAKKRNGKRRTREVPLIRPSIERPSRSNIAFRRALRKVRPDVAPYSFRRSYSKWLELAKVPRSRRRVYLGHGRTAGDTTDRYERHEVDEFLKEDAELLKKYIQSQGFDPLAHFRKVVEAMKPNIIT